MKNKLGDLNNYLYECLERVMDDDITEAEFKREVDRSRAVTDIAKTIIDSGRLSVQAAKLQYEMGQTPNIPKELTDYAEVKEDVPAISGKVSSIHKR